MKYNREQILTLRKKLIQFRIDEFSEDVDKLTDILLEYPVISYVESDVKNVHTKWIKRKYTSTGHGAFGEPEGYSYKTILGWNIDNVGCIFFDINEIPVTCSDFQIEKMINSLKTAVFESFKL